MSIPSSPFFIILRTGYKAKSAKYGTQHCVLSSIYVHVTFSFLEQRTPLSTLPLTCSFGFFPQTERDKISHPCKEQVEIVSYILIHRFWERAWVDSELNGSKHFLTIITHTHTHTHPCAHVPVRLHAHTHEHTHTHEVKSASVKKFLTLSRAVVMDTRTNNISVVSCILFTHFGKYG
jgi:hypothetical protein